MLEIPVLLIQVVFFQAASLRNTAHLKENCILFTSAAA